MTSNSQACPTCGGSSLYGYVHGQHMPCPACEGTGQIAAPVDGELEQQIKSLPRPHECTAEYEIRVELKDLLTLITAHDQRKRQELQAAINDPGYKNPKAIRATDSYWQGRVAERQHLQQTLDKIYPKEKL